MAKQVIEAFNGVDVTADMLQEASQLFSGHYGVWAKDAAQMMGKFAKAGNHVRLSKEKLRADYLPDDTASSYVRITMEDRLVGNAFACRWTYNDKTVCWITQLVVHADYRERGLAAGLLSNIRHADDDIYCIMSSHPAACMAAAKVFGSSINTVRVNFIQQHAEGIMKASPIRYIQDAKLRGSLFDPEDASGLVSCVDTGFWVDHTEPLETLAWARTASDWPLGELHDGHEFLLMLEPRRRSRSRYLSMDHLRSAQDKITRQAAQRSSLMSSPIPEDI